MAQILRSLEIISSGYSVFEKDQVLNHDQLNSLADYLDDQSRLTRISLLGIGIICGLRISRQGDVIRLESGLGVTSDGDLLRFPGASEYDRFLKYDSSKPAYAPFYLGGRIPGEMLPLYELVKGDSAAEPLGAFAASTGQPLEEMVALLFMESYISDRDLCSGTDCDNLGQDCRNTPRLLLINRSSISQLQYYRDSPDQAFGALNEIVADRPFLTPAVNTPALLAQAYRKVCHAIQRKLAAEFSGFYRHCAAFLGDLFPLDPSHGWIERLQALNARFDAEAFGIQYYYDFLKDLVETWNDFRGLLAGEQSWCCPDPAAFPKHLLLGGLAGAAPDLNRTACFPSPLVSRTSENLNHARFLVRKLDGLLQAFKLPDPQGAAIRITPSLFEEQPLEERAIPYYYRIDSDHPLQRLWNYRLHCQGMDERNYSYSAGLYNAQGAAADPLAAQIGRFSFFRIEGHLGQPVRTVMALLEGQIADRNLPLALRTLALGADRNWIVKKPGTRYSDLHHLHYLLRQDVSHQLEEVVNFSQNFKQKVDKAVRDNVITDTPSDNSGDTLKNIARDQNATVARNAARVRSQLKQPYSSYKNDSSWKQNVGPAMQAAGQFKSRLSEVVKTEFATPFDSLIANTHLQWIDWLDEIIRGKDEREDEKQLFAAFSRQHPGIQHYAGVARGGTFVLVYDQNQQVVADFMLPYYCCDNNFEQEPPQPPLRKPGLRPRWIVGNGVSLLPSRDKFIRDKLNVFKTDQLEGFVKSRLDSFKAEQVDVLKQQLEGSWNRKFDDQQKEYFGTMKESVNLLGNALIARKDQAGAAIAAGAAFSDKALQEKVSDVRQKQQAADYLRKKAAQGDVSADKRVIYEQQAKEAEAELALSIGDATRYMADSKTDVSAGSDGMAAILELSGGLQSIADEKNLTLATEELGSIRNGSTNAGLNMLVDSMIALRRR